MKIFTLKNYVFTLIAFTLLITTSIAQTTLGFYDFESGNQGWTGASRAVRTNSATYAYSGNYSFYLRDNSGANSAMTSPSYSLFIYDKIDLKFFFTAISMENGEDFFVEYNSGGLFSSWETVKRFVSGNVSDKSADFQRTNSVIHYSKTVTILATDFSFPILPTGQFRIRCDASDTNDYVMVDDVSITGTTYNTPTNGPGGVTNNLDLWLKADQLDGATFGSDGANVSKWSDNGKGNHAEVVKAGQEPVYRNNSSKNMNF